MARVKKEKKPVKLVYGTIPGPLEGYTLCFIEEEHALYLKSLGGILHGSQTWGEFLSSLPKGELDLIRNWISDENGDLPPADKPFVLGNIGPYCSGDWPEWPVQSMLHWMPVDIINKYGERQGSLLNGDFLIIKCEFEEAVITALEKYGYAVEGNDELVRRAQASAPDYYCNYDYYSELDNDEELEDEVEEEWERELREEADEALENKLEAENQAIVEKEELGTEFVKEMSNNVWDGSQLFTNLGDQTLFNEDLRNLLSSKCCENRTLLVDDLFVRLKFDIPVDNRVQIFPLKACIKLVILDPDAYLLLTTSFITNWSYIRDPDEIISCRDMLSKCGHYYIAEAHSNFCQYYTDPDTECRLDRYFRICYYAVDGSTSSVWRLLRFENGKVIDEGNLQPGEELHNKANYSGPAEYRADLSAMNAGQIPLSWCHAAAKTMSKYGVDFATAVEIMTKKGSSIEAEGVIIHNLAVEI